MCYAIHTLLQVTRIFDIFMKKPVAPEPTEQEEKSVTIPSVVPTESSEKEDNGA